MYGIGVLFPPLLEVFLWEYTTFTQGDFFFVKTSRLSISEIFDFTFNLIFFFFHTHSI